jgi:hypothetical protein
MIVANHNTNNVSEYSDAKIALTIPTGRPRVRKVVKSFLENAEHFGYDPKQFSIYLSVDLVYQKRDHKDFKLDEDIEKRVNRVEYLFEDERNDFGERIKRDSGVEKDVIDTMFMGSRGYSKQRNVAVLRAAEDGNDYAICFDDDEDPIIPVMEEDRTLRWEYLDFFTPHIRELSNGADITRGPYMGYLSPIPSDFEKDIPEKIRRNLGQALDPGSDVIDGGSFLGLMNKIRYLSDDELNDPKAPFDVENGVTGKHIYAGNMGINLNSIRNGNVPLFYTPPSARGEDTIFALQLEDLVVREVPAYIFHDPFDMYPNISEGEIPDRLENIGVNSGTKKRFSLALIGWLKYAPILIAMTSKSTHERNDRISEMLGKIGEPTEQLAKILDCPQLSTCKDVLKKYSDNLESHMNELRSVQENWRAKIAPNIGILV